MSGMVERDTAAAMRAWSDDVRRTGRRIGFVPTMGYLHAGHLSLVAEARRRADVCVASIFVNPLQFGANEDLAAYPRDLDRDRAALAEAGVDALYLPQADRMYPLGFQTEVNVPALSAGLCGRSRPGHFRGVATVVAKLFHAVAPHVAVFGEKDFQQLAVIRRMVADLDFGIEVVGAPVVREADGLAMSSRNTYLSDAERPAAACLSRALAAVRARHRHGLCDPAALVAVAREVIEAEPLARIDYVEMLDADTLTPIAVVERPAVLALAVRIGRTRLIDNTVLAATATPS
jgi:pantoate--beta-alanine ligase